MGVMRKTDMKRTVRGYVRNLGRDREGAHQKFYFGHDADEAKKRLKAIVVLWQQIEDGHNGRPGPPVWDADRLAAAKAIAKGEAPSLGKGDYEPPEQYFSRVNETSRQAGISVRAADEFIYGVGRQDLTADAERSRERLANAIGVPGATGQTLHEALRAYQDHIRHEYRDHEGTPDDNGKTKIDSIKTIMSYVPDADLGRLDYHGTDELFGTFRRRPISKRYGRPMAHKSCTNYIGEIGRFLRWLHLSKDFRWRLPPDYALISRTPRELDDDAERGAAEVPTFSVAQLRTINEYAQPIERVFFLLGLNCSYGADQAGRLKVQHLHLSDDGTSYVRRIRRKKKVLSTHLLWKQTVAGLRWALKKRGTRTDTDHLLLQATGRPYWTKTKGGNRSQAIPNLWNRLLDRIHKDYPEFPRHPFNTLRDTSADMVRRLAGAETASVHLAHKHQSGDENLGRYTNPVRKRHFKALRRLEEKLQSVFDAAGPDPWSERPRSHIGLTKAKLILDLKGQGLGVTEIARRVGTSATTIYRYLARNSAARKPESTGGVPPGGQ